MRSQFLLPFFILLTFFPAYRVQAEAAVRCTPYHDSDPIVTRDYRIYQSQDELKKSFLKTYREAARLKDRLFSDSQGQLVIPYGGGLARVADRFTQGISNHLSRGIKNRYVDAIIYPDMGHVHLLLPETDYEKIKMAASDTEKMNLILAAPNLKALYHTAEMLQMKDGDFVKGRISQDPWKSWRYFTRNLVGSFNQNFLLEILWAGPEAIYNTVRGLPGMTEVSTLYFSANENGCLSFQADQDLQYFDITFDTIPYQTK